jgi:hypothetical protein
MSLTTQGTQQPGFGDTFVKALLLRCSPGVQGKGQLGSTKYAASWCSAAVPVVEELQGMQHATVYCDHCQSLLAIN